MESVRTSLDWNPTLKRKVWFDSIMKDLRREGYSKQNGMEYHLNEITHQVEVYLPNGKMLDAVSTPHDVWELLKEVEA